MHHPATQSLLDFFKYEHLPPHLQAVSKPFGDLAHLLVNEAQFERTPSGGSYTPGLGLTGPEVTVALRKLLEAKDCAVRALVAQEAAR